MKEKNMKEAIKEAIKAYEMKEMPVGAVVVYNGEIIGKGYNKKEFAHDSTMHAEIIAIKEACKSINDWRLNECTIYVTMEPCPMCIGAIKEARIKDVICGIKNDKFNKLNEIPKTTAHNGGNSKISLNALLTVPPNLRTRTNDNNKNIHVVAKSQNIALKNPG